MDTHTQYARTHPLTRLTHPAPPPRRTHVHEAIDHPPHSTHTIPHSDPLNLRVG